MENRFCKKCLMNEVMGQAEYKHMQDYISNIDSFIKNTEFTNVSARYVNMAGAKINNMRISNSDFSESSFVETRIKNLDLSEVKFTKAEFLKTLLNGVDFSSSDITDVMFDVMSVKGMIVNQFQCVELANLIGVQVN